MVRPKLRLEMAKYVVRNYKLSVSRVCKILGLARSTYDYDEHPRDDSEIADALKELASQNKRFGHPRLFVLLQREKRIFVNHKRSGDVLAIDFVFDYIESGRRLEVLTMVDEENKVSPSVLVDH